MAISKSLALVFAFCAVSVSATGFGGGGWWGGGGGGGYSPPGHGGSGGWGDPMFRGLDGRTFYFDGIVGKIFNLLSEQDHQLNAEFGLGPHKIDALGKKTNGTFMTAFGLQMSASKVEMHVDEEGETTVTVNGLDTAPLLNETNDFTLSFVESNSVSITVEKYRPNYGYTVVARSPLVELVMFSTPKEYDPVVKELARGHLNFEMGVNPEALRLTELHGVLGQNTNIRATDTALIPEELSTLFLGDGEDTDYVVSSLFATDSKFNLFGQKKILKAGSADLHTGSSSKTLKLSAPRRFLREGAEISYTRIATIAGNL